MDFKSEQQTLEKVSTTELGFDIESDDFKIHHKSSRSKNGRGNVFSSFFEFTKIKLNSYAIKTKRYWALHPLIGYSCKRVFFGIITLLLGVALLFLILRSILDVNSFVPESFYKLHPGAKPGDPIYDAYLANRLEQLGLSGNIFTQMFRYIYNIIPFIPKEVTVFNGADVGETYTSFFYLGIVSRTSIATPGTSVWQVMSEAIGPSFFIGSIAVFFSYLIGIPLGVECARFRNKKPDSIINSISTILIAVPSLVIVIVIFLFSDVFGGSILYVTGSFSTRFWPIVALFFLLTPSIVIMTRRYVMDEISNDYTSLALAKGLSSRRIYYVHIFRNAGIRILQAIPGVFVATIFGLSILTEKQWSIPIMSRMIVAASNPTNLDVMVVMGYVTFASFVTIFTSLLGDLIISWLDPRVSITRNKS